jgi:hypothetical protein
MRFLVAGEGDKIREKIVVPETKDVMGQSPKMPLPFVTDQAGEAKEETNGISHRSEEEGDSEKKRPKIPGDVVDTVRHQSWNK